MKKFFSNNKNILISNKVLKLTLLSELNYSKINLNFIIKRLNYYENLTIDLKRELHFLFTKKKRTKVKDKIDYYDNIIINLYKQLENEYENINQLSQEFNSICKEDKYEQ